MKIMILKNEESENNFQRLAYCHPIRCPYVFLNSRPLPNV